MMAPLIADGQCTGRRREARGFGADGFFGWNRDRITRRRPSRRSWPIDDGLRADAKLLGRRVAEIAQADI